MFSRLCMNRILPELRRSATFSGVGFFCVVCSAAAG